MDLSFGIENGHRVAVRRAEKPPAGWVVWLKEQSFPILALEQLLAAHNISTLQVATLEEIARLVQSGSALCWVAPVTGVAQCGVSQHARLKAMGVTLPVVFLTTTPDLRLAVQAMRSGAENIVLWPEESAELIATIRSVLATNDREDQQFGDPGRSQADSLSWRERQVVRLVMAGLLSKEIADRLNLALITVKVHRASAMRKLRARTPAELARLAYLAGIEQDPLASAASRASN